METVTCAPYAGAVRRLRAFFQVKVGAQGAAVEAARSSWRPVPGPQDAGAAAWVGGGRGAGAAGGGESAAPAATSAVKSARGRGKKTAATAKTSKSVKTPKEASADEADTIFGEEAGGF